MKARTRVNPVTSPTWARERVNLSAKSGSRGMMNELKKSPEKWTRVMAKIT
jgi:hypothetical protein